MRVVDERPATRAREMVFSGWGDPARRPGLPQHAQDFLRAELGGIAERPNVPVKLEQARVSASALDAGARESLAAIVGAGHVRDDLRARVLHAAGKSYPDLVRQRAGDCDPAPDAVVAPGSHDQVSALLAACAQARIAVVPFGGGTSVVGGVEPLRGSCEAVIAMDLGRMDRLVAVDLRSLVIVAEAGLRGPELEQLLAGHGLTLGHVPQSFEYASLGGYVATRSAGQASTGYGRIDELVCGVRLAAPAGELVLPPLPPSAAGPQLRQLVIGSEGALGVITAVALSVRPRPPDDRWEGWSFGSFEEGAEALCVLSQEHTAPDVARVSDEEETRLSFALAGDGDWKLRTGRAYLRARGHAQGCLAIFAWHGERAEIARRRARAVPLLRRCGGVALGQGPGRAWARQRFAGPYLRDELLDRGVLVETLETATLWSRLPALHDSVAAALRGALVHDGSDALVMCHVSHLYEEGASLYFTFMTREREGAQLEQWREAKYAACDAIVAGGGTITHHHAIGRDHLPWLRDEVGERGVGLLRAAKAELDPEGIMNPEKLVPS
ncbi:MAG TPA: FAD-binding oxidoreductase [Solirubrobacteraceae bacterium]|nr:FAD-binding oxidoreductase [Solirubrobacteraceae bacterium]